MSQPVLPVPARRAGRVFAWVLGGILLVAVVAAVWVGVRGALAYGHLRDVQAGAAAGGAALIDDPGAASQTLVRLADDAAAAHALTSDPVWRAGESLPWAGPQLAAFARVAASADQLIGNSLLPLATAADGVSIDALRPVGGRIDASALASLASPALEAAEEAAQAAAGVHDIDRTPLIGLVAQSVGDADALFGRTADAIDALARTTRLLPDMLGQNGPRTYLVLVQNNAEWRSLGGIAGAAVVLRADDGALSLAGTVSSRDFAGGFDEPVAPLSDEATAIYDTKPARYFQNVTQVPDFSVGAPLAREMYRLKTGTSVDGVFALDPVTLSYLLAATGPVALPTGDSLTSDNAVPLLLNEVYFRYTDPADQDAFFAAASSAVFQALADGQGSASDLIAAFARAAAERRLLVWSADESEQAVLEGSPVAGELPVSDAQTTRFGVYLNDGTGSKMSYYTVPNVDLTWDSCAPAGTVAVRDLTLTLSLTSTAPADAATALPAYVTGGGWFGTPAGTTAVVTNLYLPEGYDLVTATMSTSEGFSGGMHEGRRVLTTGFDLAPGASAQLTVTVRATTTAATAEAFVTPTADADLSPTVVATCTAAGNEATLG